MSNATIASGLMEAADGLEIARKCLTVTGVQVDISAFHIEVPEGATALDIRFEYLSPITLRYWPRLMTCNISDIWWPTVEG